MTTLYRVNGSLKNENLTSADSIILVENSNTTSPTTVAENRNYSFENRPVFIQKDSTDSNDINMLFEYYLERFKENETNFIYVLIHSYFEDGMDNPAIDMLNSYFELSPYPSISWFSTFFNTHLKEPNISYRLLRCLCNYKYRKFSKNLISFVRGALNDKSVEVQEAAFMVLESWRTQECLDVIESTQCINPLLEDYVKILRAELEQELC